MVDQAQLEKEEAESKAQEVRRLMEIFTDEEIEQLKARCESSQPERLCIAAFSLLVAGSTRFLLTHMCILSTRLALGTPKRVTPQYLDAGPVQAQRAQHVEEDGGGSFSSPAAALQAYGCMRFAKAGHTPQSQAAQSLEG